MHPMAALVNTGEPFPEAARALDTQHQQQSTSPVRMRRTSLQDCLLPRSRLLICSAHSSAKRHRFQAVAWNSMGLCPPAPKSQLGKAWGRTGRAAVRREVPERFFFLLTKLLSFLLLLLPHLLLQLLKPLLCLRQVHLLLLKLLLQRLGSSLQGFFSRLVQGLFMFEFLLRLSTKKRKLLWQKGDSKLS